MSTAKVTAAFSWSLWLSIFCLTPVGSSCCCCWPDPPCRCKQWGAALLSTQRWQWCQPSLSPTTPPFSFSKMQHNQRHWCCCNQQDYAMQSRLQRTKCTFLFRPDLPREPFIPVQGCGCPWHGFQAESGRVSKAAKRLGDLLQIDWGLRLWQSWGVRVFFCPFSVDP